MFVMEDGKGDCARDKWGRPVVVSIGMCHGTAEEQQMQMIYASERVLALSKKSRVFTGNLLLLVIYGPAVDTFLAMTAAGAPPGCSNVLEVVPQEGVNPSFRFPDADVRTVFDLQKAHYPISLSSTNHFIGIPRALTWGFKLCKPFMDAEAYNNMKLWPSADALPEYLPQSSMLPRWGGGGTFQFDLDAYIAQRAAAEGVTVSDEVRRFGAEEGQASSEDAMNASLSMSLKDAMEGEEVVASSQAI